MLRTNSGDNLDSESLPFLKHNDRIMRLIQERNREAKSPEYLYTKLKEDMSRLEMFIKDSAYRNKLLEAEDSSLEHFQLVDLYGLDRKIKEKLGIPESSTIKYERVKCSKHCWHKHEYFYAYYWEPSSKKLKKKYIGKHLPQLFNFKISIVD